jgi:hypothetical protein
VLYQIKAHQVKLLCADPEVRELGSTWVNSCRDNDKKIGTSGDVSQTPLSALAQPFVPSTRFDSSTPRVIVESSSPKKDTAASGALSPYSTVDPLVQSPDKEDFATEESGTSSNQLEAEGDVAQSSITPDSDTAFNRSDVVSNELASHSDDESQLPPHLRTHVRALRKSRPAKPMEPVLTSLSTPVKQKAISIRDAQCARSTSIGEIRAEPRKTPPHLRATRTSFSASPIKHH